MKSRFISNNKQKVRKLKLNVKMKMSFVYNNCFFTFMIFLLIVCHFQNVMNHWILPFHHDINSSVEKCFVWTKHIVMEVMAFKCQTMMKTFIERICIEYWTYIEFYIKILVTREAAGEKWFCGKVRLNA